MCECGKHYSNNSKSQHFKSIFHKQYMERLILDTTIPVVQEVPLIADICLERGICHIPLAQFENIKHQEEINDDHFYFSNYYDYMHQQ